MKKISRLSLIRRKSVFKTSRAAWKDISDKLNIKPSQVKAKHSSKVWMWIPKKNSGFVLLKPGEKKSGKSKRKTTSKSIKRGKSVKTSRKKKDLCQNIKNALNDPLVSEIIIKK